MSGRAPKDRSGKGGAGREARPALRTDPPAPAGSSEAIGERKRIERSLRISEQAPDAYQRARELPASKLDEAPADSEVASTLWSMSYYDDQGNQRYRRDLIEEQENELMNDIDQHGRDKPKVWEVEETRLRASAILAAYEHEDVNIPAKQRQRLHNLAEGDTEGEMYKIKDNRKLGKRSYNQKNRKKSSYESAAAADGRAMLEENRLAAAKFRGASLSSKQAFPTFKPSRLKSDDI